MSRIFRIQKSPASILWIILNVIMAWRFCFLNIPHLLNFLPCVAHCLSVYSLCIYSAQVTIDSSYLLFCDWLVLDCVSSFSKKYIQILNSFNHRWGSHIVQKISKIEIIGKKKIVVYNFRNILVLRPKLYTRKEHLQRP